MAEQTRYIALGPAQLILTCYSSLQKAFAAKCKSFLVQQKDVRGLFIIWFGFINLKKICLPISMLFNNILE